MGAGKIETGTAGRISAIGGNLLKQTAKPRKLIFKQLEEALRTGGVNAKIPLIQRSVAEARQAQAGGLQQTAEQLAMSNVGGPFKSRILAGQRLAGEQGIASIPTQMAEQVIGQGMPLLGATQSLGLGAYSQGIQLGQAARMFNAQQFVRSVPFMQTGQQGIIGGVCLHPESPVRTPKGSAPIKDLTVGSSVISQTAGGAECIATVIAVVERRVPERHVFVKVKAPDGVVYVSEPHPLASRMTVGEAYPDAKRVTARSLCVRTTRDIRVDSSSGLYFVNGLALRSTIPVVEGVA